MIFSYRAVRTDGQRLKGSVEASSLEEAKRLLREQQLIIIELGAAALTKKKPLSMSHEQRAIFTSQLSQLLEVGEDALRLVLIQAADREPHVDDHVIPDLRLGDVGQAHALDRAVEVHFPDG